MAKLKASSPTPEPYKPRVVVQGDKLPVRFKKSPTIAQAFAQAARRQVLAAVYFGEDEQ